MDRKEAILRIKDHMEHHGIGKYPHLKLKEALDMAIAALSQQNEPMTLEQLREINGEPIYVTTKNYGDGWCILNWHGVNKSYTYFSRTGTSEGMTATPLSAKTYGDLWLAYRRPLEGEEET